MELEENHAESSCQVSYLEICIISVTKAADTDEAFWVPVASD